MSSPIDNAIRVATETFASELMRYRTRTGRSAGYSTNRITLAVTVGDKLAVELTFGGEYGTNNVRAATLGALMDEAYRRQGFDDREAGRLQAASDALRSLPAPSTEQ